MISRKFNNRERALLLVLAILFVISVYYLLVWEPSRISIENAEKRGREIALEMEEQEQKNAGLEYMKSKLEAIDYGKNASSHTPPYDNQQNVMKLLHQAMSKTVSYDLKAEVRMGDTLVNREIKLSFTCENYNKAQAIIRELLTGPYSCNVEVLNISTQKQEQKALTNLDVAKDGMQEKETLTKGQVQVTMNIIYYETYPADFADPNGDGRSGAGQE